MGLFHQLLKNLGVPLSPAVTIAVPRHLVTRSHSVGGPSLAPTRIIVPVIVLRRDLGSQNGQRLVCVPHHLVHHVTQRAQHKLHEGHEVARIGPVQGMQIGYAPGMRDGDRQKVRPDEVPVHQGAGHPAVAISKRMNLDKAVMQPGGTECRMT